VFRAPNAKGKVSRTWTLFHRIDGKMTRVTIGKWSTVSVDDARKRARVLQRHIIEGRNPVVEKERQRKTGRTLGEAFEQYLEARRLKLRPRTIASYRDDFR
jgi:hypothetical protein